MGNRWGGLMARNLDSLREHAGDMGGWDFTVPLRSSEPRFLMGQKEASASISHSTSLAHRQSGISLVEIMISLVTGLFLLAGVIQIYLSNKQTYRVVEASSRIQENARFAMEILGQHIRMTGFRDSVTGDPMSIFPQLTFGGYNLNPGEVIRGSDTEMVVRYQGDGVIQDCTGGNVIAPGTSITMRFSLDANNELQCASSLSGQEPLVSGINQLRFLYGIDTDGDATANCYDQASSLNAANPTACGVSLASPWSQVVSLRIVLELQSAENRLNVTGDQPLRKSYSTTIGFRNQLP